MAVFGGRFHSCSPITSDHLRHGSSFKLPALPSARVSCSNSDERTSPTHVKQEIEQCYRLINRLGRGVVYLGSSRFGPNHSHYLQTRELSKQIAILLDCTSWTGAGPGLMDAATLGGLDAGMPVGGFKIAKEAGQWTSTNYHPYLPSESYLTCRSLIVGNRAKQLKAVRVASKDLNVHPFAYLRKSMFFSARKHGLVDAVVRTSSSDKTAVVALPGGIGTLDEVFEMLTLIQLERIDSKHPVPFLLMNYDSYYSKMLDFLDDCEKWGALSKGEVASLWNICQNNEEALAYLKGFYNLSP